MRPFDFTTFPVLETSRLILREIVPTDVQAIWEIRGDYEVTKYNIGAAYQSIEQAQTLIDEMQQDYLTKTSVRWGITLKPNDTMIGMCGYNYWSRTDFRASIGYDLARAYWGRGIMPEALHVIIGFGFDTMHLNRIEADTSAENIASINVLRKLGFQQEGLQREQYFEDNIFHDLLLFSLLKRDYTADI